MSETMTNGTTSPWWNNLIGSFDLQDIDHIVKYLFKSQIMFIFILL